MSVNNFLDRLSTHLKNAIARAIAIASEQKHVQVTPLHIWLALAEEPGSMAAEIIARYNITPEYLRSQLTRLPKANTNLNKGATTAFLPELNSLARQAMEKAMLAAYEQKHNYIGTEHLLFGLTRVKDEATDNLLKFFRIKRDDLEQQISLVMQSTSRFPDLDQVADTMEEIQAIAAEAQLPSLDNQPLNEKNMSKKNKQKHSALDIFTVELTDPKHQQKIDPVVGREPEIARITNILCRRYKNNPVLIGEPGVGKTAIVEGLAKKIVTGEVPDILKDKKIFALDLTLLIAGTIYRGEFESRLKQIIDDMASQPNSLLFIDELHNIIGAGSNQGAMDAANILKPALARGDLRCIGATTWDEYKKHIADDPALERRFQAVAVDEPSPAETINIIKGVKKNYEDFHQVTLTDEAIKAAVDFSVKYLADNFLPDKAIDLIDEASAAMRAKQKDDQTTTQIRALNKQRTEYLNQKEEAIHNEQFPAATKWKEKIEALDKKITGLKNNQEKLTNQQTNKNRPKITATEIAHVLGTKIKIEPEMILCDEWQRLADLPAKMNRIIIGQNQATEDIAQTLKTSHLGLRTNRGPLASFLFIGPSGVGKTALAKTLAETLYLNSKALIKLDMGEFAESHGISKLLGSPAGYVGYKERNRFLDALRARPYSVVLFDEFDKAHADVRKLLWQILDEGELTDSAGKKISFRHAIIILTSNTGAEHYQNAGIGFGSERGALNLTTNARLAVMDKIKEEFGAPLLGRLHQVCLFNPLSLADIATIIHNRVAAISSALTTTRNITLTPAESFIQSLAKESHNNDTGARRAEQLTEKILNDLIIKKLSQPQTKKVCEYKLVKDEEYKII